MDPILIINERELRSVVKLSIGAVDLVEDAFRTLAGGGVVMPPILSMAIEAANGEVDVKTAYVPGLDVFAIKISPGFFDNPKIGIPSLNGLVVALSAKTGLVEAVFLDNGYLTNIRTAAAGAVAARWMAPSVVRTAGVLGAGVQARLQMIAAHLVRPFEEVLVWSPVHGESAACAADIEHATGAKARAVETAREAVEASQLVVTTTPARQPILMAAWLHPGLHITCMGSDQHGKNELEPQVLAAADVYACDRVSQCAELGELRSARAQGLMTAVPPEIGEIIAGTKTGRRKDDDITICDLTGTGIQDTAIASFALAQVKAMAVGHSVER